MDHLYTPWRMQYLTEDKKAANEQCVFCGKAKYVDDAKDQAEWIVTRSEYVYVTLNKFPYNNGHTLVVPYAHVGSVEDMPANVLTDMMLTLNHALAALRKVYTPHGFNIGANLGGAAGAGIPGHFHMHIVPRWGGDSNFLSIIGNTRVIPDMLDDTWRKLREVWASVGADGSTAQAKESK
ncbi:MAG TPA: HIT domain-containing protein [Aggregatilineales bacterium]|nr:HIT domain-containing protein [Aggregatilineales bacterium]